MHSTLINAPVNTDLVLLEITSVELAIWLQRLGLFIGSHIIRHDKEINYYPIRIRSTKGDVVVPAGLGIKIFVHLNSGERKPLVEMKKNETGHIETMSCGHGCIRALAHIGIKENVNVTFLHSLPHMDYITLINRKERTRLSEGEAARLWGKCEEGKESQFYFAKKNKPFLVKEIIGGSKIYEHIKTHGIQQGCTLILEAIEQAQELHKPGFEPITISSICGLRLYLSPTQASWIVVKSAVRQS